MSGAGIAVRGVTVTYRHGHTALRDASFEIPTGTVTALVGVNGGGKSTLFKAIMGFVRVSAGEIRILWSVALQLVRPALLTVVLLTFIGPWNEFLWPLAVLTKTESYTLQIGLNAFQGELQTQWHYLLAMTVVTLLPVALVFVFLQRFITTGIANTGMK